MQHKIRIVSDSHLHVYYVAVWMHPTVDYESIQLDILAFVYIRNNRNLGEQLISAVFNIQTQI